MLVTLVTHVAPGKLFAQLAHPDTSQNAPARPSKGDHDWTRAPKVLQTADSWRTGDALPAELRRFRESKTKEPNPMDSWDLIAQVKNLPLLAALLVDPGADPECREYSHFVFARNAIRAFVRSEWPRYRRDSHH
jgi:hypothetical protein